MEKMKMPLGLKIVVALMIIGGVIGILVGLIVPSVAFIGFYAASVVCGLGLYYYKRWAWYLTIGLGVIWTAMTLATNFIAVRTIIIPSEPIVIAYLLWKRKLFFEENLPPQ